MSRSRLALMAMSGPDVSLLPVLSLLQLLHLPAQLRQRVLQRRNLALRRGKLRLCRRHLPIRRCLFLLRFQRRFVQPLLQEFESEDILDLQGTYVDLFDRTRSLSLHMFEHIHGESRERGQAMIDLRGTYAEQGLLMVSDELPEYVPACLEFASLLSLKEARQALAEPVHVLEALHERLRRQLGHLVVAHGVAGRRSHDLGRGGTAQRERGSHQLADIGVGVHVDARLLERRPRSAGREAELPKRLLRVLEPHDIGEPVASDRCGRGSVPFPRECATADRPSATGPTSL